MKSFSSKTRKSLEALYIALWKADVNKQKYHERLVLFKNSPYRE